MLVARVVLVVLMCWAYWQLGVKTALLLDEFTSLLVVGEAAESAGPVELLKELRVLRSQEVLNVLAAAALNQRRTISTVQHLQRRLHAAQAAPSAASAASAGAAAVAVTAPHDEDEKAPASTKVRARCL